MRTLYRSRYDCKITGLVGGLAQYMNFDATLLRIIMIFIVFFSSGTIVVVYFIASLVVPKEPRHPNDPYYNGGRHGGRRGQGGPSGPWNMGGPNQDYNNRQESPFNQGYSNPTNTTQEPTSSLDDMMKDIEKKAMEKELQELRKKLNDYEKGDK